MPGVCPVWKWERFVLPQMYSWVKNNQFGLVVNS